MVVRYAFIAVVAAFLSGCGGGGGSDNNNGNNTGAVISQTGDSGNRLPTAALSFGDTVVLDNGTPHATLNKTITLSGEASSDPDGDTLQFAWSIESAPSGSKAGLSAANAVRTSFQPDVTGTYKLGLTLTDGRGGITHQTVTVLADNRDPTVATSVSMDLLPNVVAAITRNVTLGALVSLDASGSTDPDLDPLSISWKLTQQPAGSTASLASGGATARIQPDMLGTYKVKVSALDSKGASSETEVSLVVNNRVPNALMSVFAAPTSPKTQTSFTTAVGYDVLLGAGASTDPDGDPLTYKWELVSKPAGSAMMMTTNGNVVQTISPDVMGLYQVRLTVSDTRGASAENLLTVNVNNRRPTATVSTNATPVAQASAPLARVPSGTTLTLRGTDSYDADGDAMTYAWGIQSRPAGSTALLSNSMTSVAKFLPDVDGTYQFVLRVTDTAGAYSEKTVEVIVGSAPPKVVLDHQRVMATIGQSVSVSATGSFDLAGSALTYAWTMDGQPAGSQSILTNAKSSTMSLVPDIAGTYLASVTVSNGKLTASASAVIVADKDWSHVYNLDFAPGISRFSRAQDYFVALSGNSVRVLDLVGGTSTIINLPRTPYGLQLSPDGRSAVVTMDTGLGYVDLMKGSLVKVIAIDAHPDVVGLTNDGFAYVQTGNAWDNPRVVDFTTGTVTSVYGGSVYGCAYGFFADKLNMLAATSNCSSPSSMSYTMFDPVTHTVVRSGSGSVGGTQFWLSEDQSFFFGYGGAMYKTATMSSAGSISDLSMAYAISQSATTQEVVFLAFSQVVGGQYSYPSAFSRLVGPYMTRDADVSLPMINSKQSYGVNIFQTAAGRPAVLVQVGSNVTSVAVTYHLVVK